MAEEKTTLKSPRRDNANVLQQAIKAQIVKGALAPGSWLSQVQLAKEFGVSRGPVREALRLLEREGLVESEVNHRSRVAPFSTGDLEQLYAMRIVVEGLAVSYSATRFSETELTHLDECLHEMGEAEAEIERWEDAHRRFHLGLIAPAGRRIVRQTGQAIDHSERYRRIYISQTRSLGAGEHTEIFEACVNREGARAAALLARHLSRTALTTFMTAAPDHEPTLVRAAVRQASTTVDLAEAGMMLPANPV
jgi:DNA-binding GntR family transcriptional regulator